MTCRVIMYHRGHRRGPRYSRAAAPVRRQALQPSLSQRSGRIPSKIAPIAASMGPPSARLVARASVSLLGDQWRTARALHAKTSADPEQPSSALVTDRTRGAIGAKSALVPRAKRSRPGLNVREEYA